jgi:hypothetical protein
VRQWVLGAAAIEKKVGQLKPTTLCWTLEGAKKIPVYRQLKKEDIYFLPCMDGQCEVLCSL